MNDHQDEKQRHDGEVTRLTLHLPPAQPLTTSRSIALALPVPALSFPALLCFAITKIHCEIAGIHRCEGAVS
jgi:hypothetical protein